MGKTIAVAGKGGTGKTTFSGLLVKYLLEKGATPILAIDADPNANLNEVLGLSVDEMIGAVREQMVTKPDTVPTGMAKHQYLELRLQECLIESKGFDLLVMGRPEGPGCYCFANNVLRDVINMLCDNYPYLVLDNEAGMEHLSRRIMRDIDVLFVTTDPSLRGIRAAKRIAEIVAELEIKVSDMRLVITRTRDGVPPPLSKVISETGIPFAGTIYEDPCVTECDVVGKPLLEVGTECIAAAQVADIARAAGL